MCDSLHHIVRQAVAWDVENPASSESESEPDSDEERFKNVYDIGDWEPKADRAPRKLEIQRKKRKITAKILLPKLTTQQLSLSDFRKVVGDMDKKQASDLMAKLAKLTVKELKTQCRRADILKVEVEKTEAKSRGKSRHLMQCDVEEQLLEAKLEEIEEELKLAKKFIKQHSRILKHRQKMRDAQEEERLRDRPKLPYYIPYPEDVLAASKPF